jgi:hypothetical protein
MSENPFIKKPASNYDIRQYKRMLDQIEAYKGKRITVGHLMMGLEALLGALEHADPVWQSAFRKSWAVLDNAYANIVCKKLAALSPLEQGLVNEAVGKLEAMVRGQLLDSDAATNDGQSDES